MNRLVAQSLIKSVLKSNVTKNVSRSCASAANKFKFYDPQEQQELGEKMPKSVMETYPLFRAAMLDIPEAEECQDALNWYQRCFDYIVPYGKRFRAKTVVHVFESIVQNPSYDDLIRAHAVGWATELLQASFLIADDIVDNGTFRRGKASWHFNPDVGNIAVNDIQQLHTSAYRLIDKYCLGHPAHINVTMLMTETARQATMGQSMDLMTMPPHGIVNYDLLRMDRLETIAKYKTSIYAFCHPVRHGLYLVGLDDPQLHKDVEEMLLPLGVFYQIQDDFIDVFGTEAVSGKKGTDIQDGKCCWPIIRALEKASPEQKKILKENFGKPNNVCVEKVKAVMEAVGIREDYELYEANEYASLKKKIEVFGKKYPEVPSVIFDNYLDALFGRGQ